MDADSKIVFETPSHGNPTAPLKHHREDPQGPPTESVHVSATPWSAQGRWSGTGIRGPWRSPPTRRRRSHPRRAEALAALRTGQAVSLVARRCEVATGTLRRWAEQEGVRLPVMLGGRRPRPLDDPLRGQALAALGQGRGLADVAMELPVPLPSLRRWAEQAGLGVRTGVHPLRTAALLELRQGHSATWVGRALGLSAHKVRIWAHEDGMVLRKGNLSTVAAQRRSPRVAELITALGAGQEPAQVAARFGLCVPTVKAVAVHYLGRAASAELELAAIH